MGFLDWLLLAALAVWLIAAAVHVLRRNTCCGGSCGRSCAGCPRRHQP